MTRNAFTRLWLPAAAIVAILTTAAPGDDTLPPYWWKKPLYESTITLDQPPDLDKWTGVTVTVLMLRDQVLITDEGHGTVYYEGSQDGSSSGMLIDLGGPGIETMVVGDAVRIKGGKKGQVFTARFKIRPYMVGWPWLITLGERKIYIELNDEGKFVGKKARDEVDGAITKIWSDAIEQQKTNWPSLTKEQHDYIENLYKVHQPRTPPPVVTKEKLIVRNGGRTVEISPPPELGKKSKVLIRAISLYTERTIKDHKLRLELDERTSFNKLIISELGPLQKSPKRDDIFELLFTMVPITDGDIIIDIVRTTELVFPEDSPPPRIAEAKMPFLKFSFKLSPDGKLESVNGIKVQP